MRLRSKIAASGIAILAVLVLSCQPRTQQTKNPETGTAGGAKGEISGARAQETVTIAKGTALSVRLGDTLDTGKTSQGAVFHGTLAETLVVNSVEVAPVGSAVMGKVTNVVSSGRLNRPAEISLVLTALTAEGEIQDITTTTWSLKHRIAQEA